jgi:chlorophyll/bacteriochlorophyll a synthase
LFAKLESVNLMTLEKPLSAPSEKTPAALQAQLGYMLKLMKPITWFGATWAFMCGAVASGATTWSLTDMARISIGLLMAGPLLTGFSQVINDYFDRDVDAINEPQRPIPSGKVTLKQVALMTVLLTTMGVITSLYLGTGVFHLAGLGFLLAIAYSAPPIRAKRNGWAGNTLVALSYEGFAWMAGHLAFASLTPASVIIALLYSFGTHGIMSINDYKSVEGDRQKNINTIPVMYGPKQAAVLILITMNLAQIGVLTLFALRGQWITAAIIGAILLAQVPTQRSFLDQPNENYLKFSAIGVNFFVWGMLVAALGLRAF